MEEILNLAIFLDRFAQSHDPYEYADCIEDPIQNIVETVRLIQSGKTGGITEWLHHVVEETEEETDESETTLLLLRSIKERKKENASTYGRTP